MTCRLPSSSLLKDSVGSKPDIDELSKLKLFSVSIVTIKFFVDPAAEHTRPAPDNRQ
jgi:hypothetical protein